MYISNYVALESALSWSLLVLCAQLSVPYLRSLQHPATSQTLHYDTLFVQDICIRSYISKVLCSAAPDGRAQTESGWNPESAWV